MSIGLMGGVLKAAEERAVIEGRVINTNGFAIANALVFVYYSVPREGRPTINPTSYPDCGKHARTDAQGNFKIQGLNPEFRFRLLVGADGYQPDYVKNVDPVFSSTIARLKPLRLSAIAPENRIIGKVLDPEGRPATAAAINVSGLRRGDSTSFGSSSGRVASMAVTDEKGEFFLDCARDITAVTVLIEPRALAKQRMWLETGKAHLIRLKQGTTVTGRLFRGTEPIPGALVSMITQDREASVFMRDFDVTTDANGRFTLSNIPAENRFHLYTKMREIRGVGVTLPVQSVTTGADGTKVELGDLATKPTFALMGRVVLADGKPISSKPRIYLSLDDAYDSQDMTLGTEGVFEFGGVPSGATIAIRLNISGYRISAKNPNKDWLNEGRLVGRLDGNLEDFVIHLEPGPRLNPNQFSGDTERQPKDKPLRGAAL